jgi:predicted dienelactone hydrolase
MPAARFARIAATLLILSGGVALLPGRQALAATDPLAVIPPLGAGAYPVACSDVAQNLTPTSGNLEDYWEGNPFDGNQHYITQILTEPASAVTYQVTVPDDRELYGNNATDIIPYVAIVCYPTDPSNVRPDYPIPGEAPVPKMQRAGQAPIWADPVKKWPVVVFSHGLGGSPLASEYLQAMQLFAAHGYVVIAPFHADARFSRIRVTDLSDVYYLLTRLQEIVNMQAERPQAIRAAVDALLAHPDFRDHVDSGAIGGFGASLGGEAMLLTAGAKLTISLGLSSKRVLTDPRFVAMVGYVPYSGQKLLPAFGDDQNGTTGLAVPFMAIGGTADTTAPLYLTEQAVNNLSGTRYVIALPGVTHGLAPENVPEVFTWAITFLDAHLKDAATRRAARVLLARVQQVATGSDENVDVDVLVPAAPLAGETRVTEFFNTSIGHYFMTPYQAEANGILAGAAGPGWEITGIDFNAWQDGAATGGPVCRFYGTPGIGPNSHFFTADGSECAFVKRDPGWTYEGLTMRVRRPADGVCALDTIPVYRVYNNGFPRNDSNHRYTTSRMTREQMKAQGWTDEGTVFCVVP